MQNFITGFDGAMDFAKGVIRGIISPIEAFLSIFSNFWVGALLILLVFAIVLIINILNHGTEFSRTIKKPKTMVICAMMIALNVILGYIGYDFTAYLRVGFGFVTLPVTTMLFGPLVGCVTGILQDIVSFALKPTGGYLFTLTINVGISGMIYGAMLYKKEITFWRVLLTKLIIIVVVNILLNSIALAPTVGSGLVGILPSRIIKNVLLLPIQSVVVYALLKMIKHRVKPRV